MKNILSILMLVALLSSSCSKDDDYTDPKNLSGTEWKYILPQDEWEDEEYHLLKFVSTTKFEFWIKYVDNTELEKETTGLYSVSGNNIALDYGGDYLETGIIEGNTLSFSYDGEVLVFRKQ